MDQSGGVKTLDFDTAEAGSSGFFHDGLVPVLNQFRGFGCVDFGERQLVLQLKVFVKGGFGTTGPRRGKVCRFVIEPGGFPNVADPQSRPVISSQPHQLQWKLPVSGAFQEAPLL